MGPGEPLPAFFSDVLIAQTLVKQLGFASGIEFSGLGMRPFLAPLGILPPLTATSPNSQKLIAIEWGAVMIEILEILGSLICYFRSNEIIRLETTLKKLNEGSWMCALVLPTRCSVSASKLHALEPRLKLLKSR